MNDTHLFLNDELRAIKLTVMMRHLLCVAFALLTAARSQAQSYWVRDVGSYGNDQVNDVKVDEVGDIYITGEFSGLAQFEQGTHQAQGGLDMFVARLNAAGEVIWWKQGGGYANDRGLKLAFGPGNTVVVVGEFMGQATFQGQQMQSAGFTQDMFVVQLDRATGQQQWIRQGGGDAGSDRPYGVTVADNGQVTVVGEFKGEATWDGFTLSSLIEQGGTEPTMDVVVVSYAANGTPLWVQQGATDRQDRAVDVVNDPTGAIYVVGQFSDTITFDETHLNTMYNATFILKLDALGQEQWFRRCGGAIYDHVRDAVWTDDQELLLAGDLQGSMIFLDADPDMIVGADPFNYYLMRVSRHGEYLGSAQMGSENGLGARGIDVRNDTIAVLGEFNCQFTDLSAHYGGAGLWMAAGPEDIFISRHLVSDLSFVDGRQFGGSGEKQARQVASLLDGSIVACGGFDRGLAFNLRYPVDYDVDVFPGFEGVYGPGENYFCTEDWDVSTLGQDAVGLMDGFVVVGYDRDSVEYDFWKRNDGDCDDDAIWTACIRWQYDYEPGCTDTVTVCGGTSLSLNIPFYGSLPLEGANSQGSMGPGGYALWNTGDTTSTIVVSSTGWYGAVFSAENGCWSWSDSIYVVVDPYPPHPLLSDDVVVNTADQFPQNIAVCSPDTIALWCTNLDTTNSWLWGIANQWEELDTLSLGDSITVDSSGYYMFQTTTDAGCRRSVGVWVQLLPTDTMPDLDLDLSISFPQDTANTDSVWICAGSQVVVQVDMDWSILGDSVAFPSVLDLSYSFAGVNGPWGYIPDYYSEGFTTSRMLQPGWNTVTLTMRVRNAPCGNDSLFFVQSESIWVGFRPWASLPIDLTGNSSTVCAGDSVLLTASCPGCNAINWSGIGMIAGTTSSVWVHATGTYWVTSVASGGDYCYYNTNDFWTLSPPPGPLLQSNPPDAIICPNDSVLIYTNAAGTNVVWYGPQGPLPDTDTQLWADIPGDYFLTMVDAQGCELTSDVLLVTGYGTPFLNISPDNILCMADDEVTMSVVTTVPSSVVWAAPLGGNALQQVVDQPGTYSVTATACDITTSMTITVVASDVNAQVIDPGPFVLCPGDSIVLQAGPGAEAYLWLPLEVFAESIVVSEPGEYTLQAIDGNGCVDESAPILVSSYAFVETIAAVGDTVCAGGTAVLSATGSGLMTWYSDPGMLNSVYVGSTFTAPGILNDSTFYVAQSDNDCTSGAVAVQVIVLDLSVALSISGDETVCLGAPLLLTAEAAGATSFSWTTPNGIFSGNALSVLSCDASDAGTYFCEAHFAGCGSLQDSMVVNVLQTVLVDIGPDVALCDGDTASFFLSGTFTSILWNGAVQGPAFQISEEGLVWVTVTDGGDCPGSDTAFVDVLTFSLPLEAYGIEVCAGATGALGASGSGLLQWSFEPDMDPVVATGGTLSIPNAQVTTTAYVMQTEYGCTSGIVPVELGVLPRPFATVVDPPLAVCEGDTLLLECLAPGADQLSWSGPSGAINGPVILIAPFTAADSGAYTVVPFAGACEGEAITVRIGFLEPIPFTLGPDTSFCIGGGIELVIPATHTQPSWSTGLEAAVLEVFTDGSYTGYGLDMNGCWAQDEVHVAGEDCETIVPNFITPNNDGVHDVWQFDASALGYGSVDVMIFDRLGVAVFHSQGALAQFRGNHDNGEPLSEGVYYYVLGLRKRDGQFVERKGYLHLNR